MARYIAGFQPEARKYGRIFGPAALRFGAVPGRIRRSGPSTISIGHPEGRPWPAPDAPLAVPRSGAAARPFVAVAAGAPPCAAVGPVPPSAAVELISAGAVAEVRPCAAAGPPSGVVAMELPSWAEAEPPLAEVAPERRALPVAEAAPRAPPMAAGLAARLAAVGAAEQALPRALTARRRWVAVPPSAAVRPEPLRQRPVSRDRRPARAALRARAGRSD
jgi:hypothetical protein